MECRKHGMVGMMNWAVLWGEGREIGGLPGFQLLYIANEDFCQ